MSYLKYTALTPELYQYTLDISTEESPYLYKIHEENEKHPQIHMQISSDQAQFLQFIIRSKQMKSILEIGTFLGYSAAAFAEALPPDGKVITCDIDEMIVSKAKHHWKMSGLEKKIECMMGPALDTMQHLCNKQKFDLIFIDADKKNSIAYYQQAIKLLNEAGIIAVDNIFFHGEVCKSERSKAAQYMHEFNLHVKQDDGIFFSIVPIADGLMLIQKK